MIQRKGNTVRYACGKAKPAGVKLKDSQVKKPSRILIHLDRLNLWRPKMTLLVRGISVEGLEMPQPAP